MLFIKDIKRKLKLILINFQFKGLSTKQIFIKIYKDSLWGEKSLEFNSGPGSHNKELVFPFLEFVNSFIINKKIKTIVDLGCGDFNIGKDIYKNTNQYHATDIVPDLIDHNKKLFKDSKIKFECYDFINDPIPEADCVILRQVLQHLDNNSILKILDKIKSYKYVIITEHIPAKDFVPNIDKKTGPTTRLEFNSGVDIEKHPFYFNYISKKEINLLDNELGGIHKTVIYTVN
jgi:SAM-dependent methyltransferase